MSRAPWLAALVWAAAIVVATSIPGRNLPRAFPHADKLVHLAIYGVLGALVARALRVGGGALPVRVAVVAVAAVAVFAAADEWHQQFVPGRSMDRLDWLADLLGASAGLAALATMPARSEQRS